MKREAKFNTLFNHWLKEVYKQTAAFELKQTTSDSLPFTSLKMHQILALSEAKKGVMVFKIPDAGFQNPFDTFSLAGVPAFVVVKYPGFFCLIDIEDWLMELSIRDRESLTSERAKKIATITVATSS